MTTIEIDSPVRRHEPAGIPLARIVSVELRKSFDTRAGFWLLCSIAITAALATVAVIAFAPAEQLTFHLFTQAIIFPMAVILPMVAALSVTGEWSQRSGLTTFTLVPHRGRIVLAKGIVAVSVAVASMLLAFILGAIGTLAGAAVTGVEVVWDDNAAGLLQIVLVNVVGLLIGFMLGVLIRSSAGAIVAYFVYTFLLPTVFVVFAANQEWFRDVQPWVDPNYFQDALFNGSLAATQWLQLGATTLIWLVLPLTVGMWALLRSEIK